MDNTFDKMFYCEGNLIGGVDESGVSDIAGPLVAACVILPKIDIQKDDLKIFEISDCKEIHEKYRAGHAETIWQTALGIGIGEVTPEEIDYLGRIGSTKLAMFRAVAACKTPSQGRAIVPDYLLVDKSDSVVIPTTIRQNQIEQGDTKSLCTAAASIVAKVYRDGIMRKLHESYPYYDWISNKGYPCENHYKGLDSHGAQLGIHRLKRWPFKKNPKKKEDHRAWEKRRIRWRQVTLHYLQKEVGSKLWLSKPPF